MGSIAARRLGLPPPVLDVHAQADLVHLSRPVWEAEASDVVLVVVAGVPRLGDERFAELFERTGVAVARLEVRGSCKLVAAPLATILERVLEDWPQLGPALACGPRRPAPRDPSLPSTDLHAHRGHGPPARPTPRSHHEPADRDARAPQPLQLPLPDVRHLAGDHQGGDLGRRPGALDARVASSRGRACRAHRG